MIPTHNIYSKPITDDTTPRLIARVGDVCLCWRPASKVWSGRMKGHIHYQTGFEISRPCPHTRQRTDDIGERGGRLSNARITKIALYAAKAMGCTLGALVKAAGEEADLYREECRRALDARVLAHKSLQQACDAVALDAEEKDLKAVERAVADMRAAGEELTMRQQALRAAMGRTNALAAAADTELTIKQSTNRDDHYVSLIGPSQVERPSEDQEEAFLRAMAATDLLIDSWPGRHFVDTIVSRPLTEPELAEVRAAVGLD